MVDMKNLLLLLEPRGTSSKLSAETGISEGNITDWKKGKSKPGADALVLIADYFGCSVDFLLGRTTNPKINE